MSEAKLHRREVMEKLMAARGDALCVAGLGSSVWDLAAVDHRAENFYIWGGMGGAAATGLGLALAQPQRPVWVITGDGEMMMGLGTYATIAALQPSNLAVIVLDNEHYAETGMQRAHTGRGADLAAIARGAGIRTVHAVADEAGLDTLIGALKGGRFPLAAVIKVDTAKGETVQPPRDGIYVKHRFRAAVLGAETALHPK